MREGSLEAPTRHPLPWKDEEFYDEAQLDAELRRVFDICHGCRRCFNLCESFPRLFELIDQGETGEVDGVESVHFGSVVDACTLCDMCFMTKCPYVPPHAFDLDFPHLMLRYRAVEYRKGNVPWSQRQLTETDRNGKLLSPLAPVVNWACETTNRITRPVLEKSANIDQRAVLPKYCRETFMKAATHHSPVVNPDAPGYGRKVVLYATCFVNYNTPAIGLAAQQVLAHNGVESVVVYPECCGMPQLEQGNIARVAEKAEAVAENLRPWIEKGYDIIALVPSCALMLKFEWPLLLPDHTGVRALSAATFDLCEYIVRLAKDEGLVQGMRPLENVTVHIACHARAQNMGHKAAEMLRLLPEANVHVIERCSGHGGSWGVFKENFDIALKVGKPVVRQVQAKATTHTASECPLAALHIAQGLAMETEKESPVTHPIELLALAYGLGN